MKCKINISLSFLLVSGLAVIFFLLTSSFNYFTQEPNYIKWSSPDETANYFFAKRFSDGKELAFFDAAAVIGDNMVMPRSVRSDAGWLKPVSFLGIILIYGSIGSVLGAAVIPFLTPFFAALGIIFFFLLMRKIFSERVGLISAFLLASFPVYIYYTVRSMFHNVLFVVLVIISLYLLVLAIKTEKNKLATAAIEEQGENKKIWQKFLSLQLMPERWLSFIFAFFGGIFLGLAVITRTSELIWLAPALGLLWLFYIRRFGFMRLILTAAGFFLAIMPTVYFNQLLYSAPIYGGYNEMNRSIDDLSRAGSGIINSLTSGGGEYVEYIKSIYHNIFYFGFNPDQSVLMAKQYIWEMFSLLVIIFIIGSLLVLVFNLRRPQKKYLVYFLIFILISSILIFYYGSWKFNDNPDPNRFTIGNSYTRYWLPIYLMMMPIASIAIIRLSKALLLAIKNPVKKWRRLAVDGLQIIVICFFIISGINFVLFGSEEGLAHLYYNNLLEKDSAHLVFSLTEPDSIIITRYYDKFLFPDRRVIMGSLPNAEILAASTKLVHYYPVYYYNFYLDEDDVSYLNERKLPEYNLRLELVKKVRHDFGLYRLLSVPVVLEAEVNFEEGVPTVGEN